MLIRLKALDIKDERFFKSFTGVSWSHYKILREAFASKFDQYQQSRIKPEGQRKRKSGGGRKSNLPGLDDKLVFILHYLKAYPTMDNQASTFGMSRGSACSLVHQYAALLRDSLEQLTVLPKRQLTTPEQLLEYLKELGGVDQLIIDATERPHRRLRDPEQRNALYSGKKSDSP